MVSHLQVGVPAAGAAPAADRLAPGRAVEEVAVFITAAVLLQDVPHLRLKERHVHVDRHHLQKTSKVRTQETGKKQTDRQETGRRQVLDERTEESHEKLKKDAGCSNNQHYFIW